MSRAQDRYEALVSVWIDTAESFGLRCETFAPPPPAGRLARLGQHFSGKAAGVQFGRGRIGHVLTGQIDGIVITVVAGTETREGGGDNVNVSEITHYRAAAPWLPAELRIGPRRPGVKDRLRYHNGETVGWEWIDIDGATDLLVRARDQSMARSWLDRPRAQVLRSAFSARIDLRMADGGIETDSNEVEADASVLTSNLRAVHDLALRLRETGASDLSVG